LAAFVETLAPTRCNHDATDAGMRNPTTGITGCCARAASGHAAAPLRTLIALAPPHRLASSNWAPSDYHTAARMLLCV
jgi:hypothetical protein